MSDAGLKTLAQWIASGRGMLSGITSGMLCRELGINERQLRNLTLEEICLAPQWGVVAEREFKRWGYAPPERS